MSTQKLKQTISHAKNTRPAWYHQYHQWPHHKTLHWATFSLSTGIIMLGLANVVYLMNENPPLQIARGADTVTTQEVNPSSLSLVGQPSATLSSVSVNSTAAQNSSGNLGVTTITDDRGSGAGWSATATASHFTAINAAVMSSGANNTVTSGGTFSNATGGIYTITIDSAGDTGAATFTVSGLESVGSTTTGTDVAIGTYGVTATFASASYQVGDQWTIRVDVIPVTGLTITPSAVTTIAGSSTGVTPGSEYTFTGVSDPATIMSASSNNGMGSYSNNPALELVIPANSYANTYTATITETVN